MALRDVSGHIVGRFYYDYTVIIVQQMYPLYGNMGDLLTC